MVGRSNAQIFRMEFFIWLCGLLDKVTLTRRILKSLHHPFYLSLKNDFEVAIWGGDRTDGRKWATPPILGWQRKNWSLSKLKKCKTNPFSIHCDVAGWEARTSIEEGKRALETGIHAHSRMREHYVLWPPQTIRKSEVFFVSGEGGPGLAKSNRSLKSDATNDFRWMLLSSDIFEQSPSLLLRACIICNIRGKQSLNRCPVSHISMPQLLIRHPCLTQNCPCGITIYGTPILPW